MSFLNPVNLPVLRFSSTDADAPQINYNSRTAGDVKAVLKACLVAGYGDKESAGWSIVNEANHVAEFVSPSAAMSDYRLGIDDTSASSTTWYYQYKDARINPTYNAPVKAFTFADKTHATNGWQLFVTERGLIFVEILYATLVSALSTRITYFGQLKSALADGAGKNIAFFNIGHESSMRQPEYLYNNYPHLQLGEYTNNLLYAAIPYGFSSIETLTDVSVVDLVSPIYMTTSTRVVFLAELVGLLAKVVNKQSDIFGVHEMVIGTRPALQVCSAYHNGNVSYSYSKSRNFLIYLDYWEY